MQSKYRIVWINGDVYIVIKRGTGKLIHKGSLADCYAWIESKNKGYFNE